MNAGNMRRIGVQSWWKRFRENLGFWTLQCVISALPGFCIAMGFLKLSWKSGAPLGMMAAFLTIVILVNSFASLSETLTSWKSLPSRGLRVALHIRGVSSFASLMVIGALLVTSGSYENPVIILMPDIWTGLTSTILVSLLSMPFGLENPLAELTEAGTNLGFLTVYLIAIIDALILCFLMFILSFVSMLVIQIRDRRRMSPHGVVRGSAILNRIRAIGPGNPIRYTKRPIR